jgi:superoxide dismutase
MTNGFEVSVCLQSTLEFHWGKHHQAYVTNLNNQIKGTPLEKLSLDEVWFVFSETLFLFIMV